MKRNRGAFAPRCRGNSSRAFPGVEEPFELPAADRVLEFADGLGLDLPDPLAGDLEDAADLFEGVGVPVAEAVAELDDFPLAVSQRLEDRLDLVLQHLIGGGRDRRIDVLVFDEVTEVTILALADR